ncbi:MAG: SpoIIIAH-like family protein [Clostridia bacterium]|nr:SpoIIIAH-like family protein [Clostridia bacterium]
MKQTMASRVARFGGCAALLALLAVSSYGAGGRIEAPAVPVLIETVSSETLSGTTMEQTRTQLAVKREEALSLLESVLDDPSAGETERNQALAEKTQIARRMETEASIEALLAHMGFADAAVIMGEGTLSIVVPWQAAENEQSRVRLIDAAIGQSGLTADAVKIILAKK